MEYNYEKMWWSLDKVLHINLGKYEKTKICDIIDDPKTMFEVAVIRKMIKYMSDTMEYFENIESNKSGKINYREEV